MDNNEMNNKPREMSLDEILNSNVDDILREWMHIEKKEEEAPVGQPIEPVTPEASVKAKTNKTGWQGTVLLYLHDLVYMLAGLILIFLLLFRIIVVSGTSMNDTLLDGDCLLLLSNTFYHDPQYGDVVVASKQSFDNGSPIVKRVIATEGQEVDIDFLTGVVYVDGVALDEPYTSTPTNTEEGIEFPLVVKEGCLFVMGDNRNGSKDSRHPEIGLVDKREILGKVFFLVLPGTNYDQVEKDFGRIGVVN